MRGNAVYLVHVRRFTCLALASFPTTNTTKRFMPRSLKPIWSVCGRRQNAPDAVQSASMKISCTENSTSLHDTMITGTSYQSFPVLGAALNEVEPIPIRCAWVWQPRRSAQLFPHPNHVSLQKTSPLLILCKESPYVWHVHVDQRRKVPEAAAM